MIIINSLNFFYSINEIIDRISPLVVCKVKKNDRPWITPYFRSLIAQRGASFISGNYSLFTYLHNLINHTRKSLQKQCYLDKINKLRTDNPAKWWQHMKSICRFNKNMAVGAFDSVTYNTEIVSLAYYLIL
jgi:hypothetical protein